ncbi:hypothetical protein BD779DRAFT_1537254 [Infundibulicybe gibba]|nr:hypothetical protein BD779DRAFT_1537254 [Infundibulicybe gibba]
MVNPGQPEAVATAQVPVFASLGPPKLGLNRGFQAKPSRHITTSHSHLICPYALAQTREVLAASHTRERLLTQIYYIILVGSCVLSCGYLTKLPHPRVVIRRVNRHVEQYREAKGHGGGIHGVSMTCRYLGYQQLIHAARTRHGSSFNMEICKSTGHLVYPWLRPSTQMY